MAGALAFTPTFPSVASVTVRLDFPLFSLGGLLPSEIILEVSPKHEPQGTPISHYNFPDWQRGQRRTLVLGFVPLIRLFKLPL
jgi:hypothetical protein